MQRPNFYFWCDADRLYVKFVSSKALGRVGKYRANGDYGDLVIRLPRYETLSAQRTIFWHEFGHYVYERQEMTSCESQETYADMLTWVEVILNSDKNDELREFLLERR